MDHRPFEDWLLEKETLGEDQKQQLNAHLRDCASCRALAAVELALESASTAAPAAGFSDRFQVRLAVRKKTLRRRNFWGFLFLTLSVVALLVRAAWPVLGPALESPVDLLVSWASGLIALWASLMAMFRAGAVVVAVVPPFVWVAVLFAAACWSLLWLFSLLKFSKGLQGV
jgi:hypothetical protein